mgnify:CR=1 FL=1
MSALAFFTIVIAVGLMGFKNKPEWSERKPEWSERAERINKGLESGGTWEENSQEESYDSTKEDVFLVDEKGMPQAFESIGSGSNIWFTAVPKGWKLIRVPILEGKGE